MRWRVAFCQNFGFCLQPILQSETGSFSTFLVQFVRPFLDFMLDYRFQWLGAGEIEQSRAVHGRLQQMNSTAQ
jgi:hypothetical protein